MRLAHVEVVESINIAMGKTDFYHLTNQWLFNFQKYLKVYTNF